MSFPEAEIRRGLDEDEFFPVFQPIVELRTGQLAGFEVLARWRPHGGRVILPDAFIPDVEKAGLIDRLTATILARVFACPVIKESPLMLAFNLSATQLLDPDLPSRIEASARGAGFALDRLTVEITESALVDDLRQAQAVAQAIKGLNCRLALDDFGTGYSSLKHLHALPFDVLKVDRSFVSSMTQKRESRKIVASVVALGQSLGLTTAAEGVETQPQAEMLFWMGCDLAQGWLFGKPVPAQELTGVMGKPPWNSPFCAVTMAETNPLMSLEAIPAHRLAQLQAIYDGAPVGLCFLDRNMRYVSLNRQLAQMNGVPAAAHLGRTPAEVIPHVFPIIEPFIRRALNGEPVVGVEAVKPPRNEADRQQNVLLSYQPVRDEGGDVLGVSVAVMDVTQNKRTEEALRQSEDHYRHMINLSPHVPWVLDADGEVVEASRRWEDYTGQPMDEAMGHGWIRMLHSDDVQPTIEAIRTALETGLPIDVEYRIRKPGEDWKWMRSRGAPRFSASGQVVCIYGVVEEIEGQKQITAELQTCVAELHAAVDAVPIGIVLADGNDGTIYRVNPFATQTFKTGLFPGQKLAEYPMMGVLDADGKPIAADEYPLARAIQRGDTVEAKPFLYRRADGIIARLSLSSRPIRSDDGRLIGGMMLIRDPAVAC